MIVCDEEVGSPEGQAILRRELEGAACALVLEAGRAGRPRSSRRARARASVKVTARGKAAHAGNAHDKGANAIWALARFVDRAAGAHRLRARRDGQRRHDQRRAEQEHRARSRRGALDFRFVSVADGEATVAALRAAAAEAAASVPGTSLAVEGGPLAHAARAHRRERRALPRVRRPARAVGLGDGESPLLGGGSDASTTASMGIPCIDGLGPRGSGFHTKEELIEVATLVPKAEAMAAFIAARATSVAPAPGSGLASGLWRTRSRFSRLRSAPSRSRSSSTRCPSPRATSSSSRTRASTTASTSTA